MEGEVGCMCEGTDFKKGSGMVDPDEDTTTTLACICLSTD
jgi:hypothetical protein